jgi:hypothetical protein
MSCLRCNDSGGIQADAPPRAPKIVGVLDKEKHAPRRKDLEMDFPDGRSRASARRNRLEGSVLT